MLNYLPIAGSLGRMVEAAVVDLLLRKEGGQP